MRCIVIFRKKKKRILNISNLLKEREKFFSSSFFLIRINSENKNLTDVVADYQKKIKAKKEIIENYMEIMNNLQIKIDHLEKEIKKTKEEYKCVSSF